MPCFIVLYKFVRMGLCCLNGYKDVSNLNKTNDINAFLLNKMYNFGNFYIKIKYGNDIVEEYKG